MAPDKQILQDQLSVLTQFSHKQTNQAPQVIKKMAAIIITSHYSHTVEVKGQKANSSQT